jgi:hypothetical protein
MKKSKSVLAVVTLTLCLPRNSLGFQDKPNDVAFTVVSRAGTAETLVNECKAAENVDPDTKTVPARDAMKVGRCFGLVNGVLDSDKLRSAATKERARYCVPESVSEPQAAKVVVKYGNDHPAELYLPAVTLVMFAMQEAFPCG